MNAAVQLNFGEAAARSGVSAKMVRHYESLGLLPAVARTESGYRRYGEREVHTLRFVRRAGDLGFSMAEIAELLKLWQNRRRASADVKRIARQHVADLERRMAAPATPRYAQSPARRRRKARVQFAAACHQEVPRIRDPRSRRRTRSRRP